MRRLALLPLCLLLGAAHAADDQKDLAYSMGAKIGERLRAEAPGLPLDESLRGLSRTYKGEKPELDPARMEKLLNTTKRAWSRRARVRSERRRQRSISWPWSGASTA